MKKKLLLAVLTLSMAVALCACTGNANGTENSEKESSQDSQGNTSDDSEKNSENENDGKVLYKITVVDENNNPIPNAMVQMCKDSCLPGSTGENGVAEFKLPEDTYKVSFMSMPEGYTYSTEKTEFYFEDGKTELTIVLKAAQ